MEDINSLGKHRSPLLCAHLQVQVLANFRNIMISIFRKPQDVKLHYNATVPLRMHIVC